MHLDLFETVSELFVHSAILELSLRFRRECDLEILIEQLLDPAQFLPESDASGFVLNRNCIIYIIYKIYMLVFALFEYSVYTL
jgi:hypothetical protein